MKRYLSHDELFELCRHRWYEILSALIANADIRTAIQQLKASKYVECPLESPQERRGKYRFRIRPEIGSGVCYYCEKKWNSGFAFLIEMNGWDYPTAAEAIKKHLGIGGDGRSVIEVARQLPEPKPREAQVDAGELRCPTLERLMDQWRRDCYPLTHELSDPVRRYLIITRGLAGLNLDAYPTLRCHPRLGYYDQKGVLVGYFPAMVALIQGPDGRVVGQHRTYLTPEGDKAPVPTVKKVVRVRYRQLDGSAIRLGRAGLMMGKTEGIENALSVVLGTPGIDMTMWAARSAGALATLEVPSITNHVIGWGDLDQLKRRSNGTVFDPGREAVEALLRRMVMEGRATDLFIPDPELHGPKADWNDLWRKLGVAGFPQPVYRPGHLPALSSFVTPLAIAA